MDKQQLKHRTKSFSLAVIKLIGSLPDTKATRVIGNQMLRSATSVGANYRSACRAKSDKDFLNKIIIVEEEADETCYWRELPGESGIVDPKIITPLLMESSELTAIFTAAGKTVRNRMNNETGHKKPVINNPAFRDLTS